MTHCEVCRSRIYTYKTFKIGIKTVCYHCKIKDLEEKLLNYEAFWKALLDYGTLETSELKTWMKHMESVWKIHGCFPEMLAKMGDKFVET